MKRVALLSHCILNPFCEYEEPAAKKLYREFVAALMENDIGILQLPCPELTYQGLERESIVPGDKKGDDYADYCKKVLEPVINNVIEYRKNNIEVIAVLGIDTSPSCSALDKSAFMMKVLLDAVAAEGISIKTVDVPVTDDWDPKDWIEKII